MPNSFDWLKKCFADLGAKSALITADQTFSYQQLLEHIERWIDVLEKEAIGVGSCVAIRGQASIETISLLVALISRRCIAVPFASITNNSEQAFLDIAAVRYVFSFDHRGQWEVIGRDEQQPHRLMAQLVLRERPGLVLFSSGSTGVPKASLLDFDKLLQKYAVNRGRGMRTLAFLLLDHIGGLNTLFAVLTQGGTLVVPTTREPESIARQIAQHKIELLPTSPTFLRMLLMSGAYERHDLSSLQLVTYGTEPMPETTLQAIAHALPNLRLKQTYGLSELGIMSTRSKRNDSTLVKIGGADFKYRIVDNILWIKSKSAMLGYLNAASPFDEDGWFNTGDMVEVHGEYMRILGRKSEMINVGGQKLFPHEVESVLMKDTNVADATVSGRQNPITGQIVIARVSLVDEEDDITAVRQRLRKACAKVLESYKVPRIITVTDAPHHGARFKKIRSQ